MDRFESILSMLDYVLSTRRKRHIVGGVLMSIALFFGGLAATIMSLKSEEPLCIVD
jgi:hypothetical protein